MSENNEPIFSVLNGKTTGYLVSGAIGELAGANGTYCPNGTIHGRTKYTFGSFSLEYDSSLIAWAIKESGRAEWLYEALGDTENPPLSGWSLASLADVPDHEPSLSETSC